MACPFFLFDRASELMDERIVAIRQNEVADLPARFAVNGERGEVAIPLVTGQERLAADRGQADRGVFLPGQRGEVGGHLDGSLARGVELHLASVQAEVFGRFDETVAQRLVFGIERVVDQEGAAAFREDAVDVEVAVDLDVADEVTSPFWSNAVNVTLQAVLAASACSGRIDSQANDITLAVAVGVDHNALGSVG